MRTRAKAKWITRENGVWDKDDCPRQKGTCTKNSS